MSDRVAESDRERALDELRAAVGRGALDLVEFDRRAVLVTRTDSRGELEELLDGLDPARAERELRRREWRDYAAEWRWWLAGAVVLTGVWAIRALVDGTADRFWPGLPLGVWALVLVALPLLPRRQTDITPRDRLDG